MSHIVGIPRGGARARVCFLVRGVVCVVRGGQRAGKGGLGRVAANAADAPHFVSPNECSRAS